jgi:alanyl-tRNA synthetase
MTTRLYYTDAGLRSFDAEVAACTPASDRFHVVLDRTAFYPASGGQPFDTGRLGGVEVVDVQDADDGTIVHVLVGPLPVGSSVHGDVDWPRRFDHMQQHTGQHMLSAAFDRLGVRTESFHLGSEVSTIDLAREVRGEEVDRAEAAANAVVWEDRPVTVRFVEGDEIARLALRKPPARSGTLRIVEVDGFDVSACGGTHVARTGMVGLIAITGVERVKGASRVSFACGGRALRSHGNLREVVLHATRALSVLPSEVKPAIERLQADARETAKVVRRLHEELAAHRAAALRAEAETIGPYRAVVRAEAELDGGALKGLASAVVSGPGLVAAMTGRGTPVPVVVARSADVPLDAAALLRDLVSELGGRGGGSPAMAQGGVAAAADAVLSALRDRLVRAH